MANLEKINFGSYGYHAWLVGKINGMKEALDSNQSFEHSSDSEMLRRKLAAYERALKELE